MNNSIKFNIKKLENMTMQAKSNAFESLVLDLSERNFEDLEGIKELIICRLMDDKLIDCDFISKRHVQEKFLQLVKDRYDKFYVPSNSHSYGFNECTISIIDTNNFEIAPDESLFLVKEEGNEKKLTFKELIANYPKFSLSKNFAFKGHFETWKRFDKAIHGKTPIDLIDKNFK